MIFTNGMRVKVEDVCWNDLERYNKYIGRIGVIEHFILGSPIVKFNDNESVLASQWVLVKNQKAVTRKRFSKSLRYRVLKRDLFTCQYCGRRPPVVILHIDHKIPVAKGGTNDFDNLLTACEECNLGKGIL